MDAMQYINQAPVKAAFYGHFVLSSLAMISDWLSPAYTFYNIVFLITLMWSTHSKDSHEPVLLAILVNLTSIVFDALLLGIYWGMPRGGGSWFGFSAFMSIANLLLRPLTSLMLYRLYNERLGRYSSFGFPGFGVIGASPSTVPGSAGSPPGRGAYENIDSVPHQSVPSPIHVPDDRTNYQKQVQQPPAYPTFN